ncbi:hypothetical protein GN956_G12120 [Arapaima gigas]
MKLGAQGDAVSLRFDRVATRSGGTRLIPMMRGAVSVFTRGGCSAHRGRTAASRASWVRSLRTPHASDTQNGATFSMRSSKEDFTRALDL